ncbi:hypothetical protein MHU86_14199 [Fragilaria crotonensis]|nr:hypothetical protein MHU86_14199 [Fragilaria crotonensis]
MFSCSFAPEYNDAWDRKNKASGASLDVSSDASQTGKNGKTPNSSSLIRWPNKKCMAPCSCSQRCYCAPATLELRHQRRVLGKQETAAMDPRAAPQLKLANTYSSCIEQPCMRLFFALCAHEGYVSLKVDATNAYANSPPPNQPTFVVIDDQYADWYLARHGTVLSRNGAPCSTCSRPSRIRSALGKVRELCHRSSRFHFDHPRAQSLSRNLQGTPNAYMSPS